MATSNAVCWFEIPTRDIQRAAKFYEAAFGQQLAFNELGPMKMAWFPMQQGVSGAPGSLVQVEGAVPSHQGTLVYFGVETIDPALQKISAAGGKTLQPRMSIGEYGFIALFEDTEGNRIGLHEAPAK